jgi:hypothetical protein
MKYKRTSVEALLQKHQLAGIHPAAKLLPPATDQEFQALCVDVAAHGIIVPVEATPEKLLLDGLTRLQAAAAVGIDPPIIECSPEDPVAWVLSKNAIRRHLTTGQKAALGAKIANLPDGVRSDRSVAVGVLTPRTREQVALTVGTTTVAISQIRAIKEYAPEEYEKVATVFPFL